MKLIPKYLNPSEPIKTRLLKTVTIAATLPYRTPEQLALVDRERNMYIDAARSYSYGDDTQENLLEIYKKYPELKSYLKRMGISEKDFTDFATNKSYLNDSHELERRRLNRKEELKKQAEVRDKVMRSVSHLNPHDLTLSRIMTGILGTVTGAGILGDLTAAGTFSLTPVEVAWANSKNALEATGKMFMPSTYTTSLGFSPTVGGIADAAMLSDLAYHGIDNLTTGSNYEPGGRYNNNTYWGLEAPVNFTFDALTTTPLFGAGKNMFTKGHKLVLKIGLVEPITGKSISSRNLKDYTLKNEVPEEPEVSEWVRDNFINAPEDVRRQIEQAIMQELYNPILLKYKNATPKHLKKSAAKGRKRAAMLLKMYEEQENLWNTAGYQLSNLGYPTRDYSIDKTVLLDVAKRIELMSDADRIALLKRFITTKKLDYVKSIEGFIRDNYFRDYLTDEELRSLSEEYKVKRLSDYLTEEELQLTTDPKAALYNYIAKGLSDRNVDLVSRFDDYTHFSEGIYLEPDFSAATPVLRTVTGEALYDGQTIPITELIVATETPFKIGRSNKNLTPAVPWSALVPSKQVFEKWRIPIKISDKGKALVRAKLNSAENELQGDGIVVGSTRLVANDIIEAVPHDIEILTTKDRYLRIAQKIGFVEKEPLEHVEGFKGTSKYGDTDVNIIPENEQHEVMGKQVNEYIKTFFPEEYRLWRKALADAGIYDLRIPKIIKGKFLYDPQNPASCSNFLSSEEFYLMILLENAVTQQLIQDMFASSKSKHVGRSLAVLMDPSKTALVRESLNKLGRGLLGDLYKDAHVYYPNLEYTNIEANKAFLRAFSLPEDLATNPEIMENLINKFLLEQELVTRGLRVDASAISRALATNYALRGGAVSGPGGNATAISAGGGFDESTTFIGILRSRLAMKSEELKNPQDLLEAFNKTIPLSEDSDIILEALKSKKNPELTALLNKYNLELKDTPDQWTDQIKKAVLSKYGINKPYVEGTEPGFEEADKEIKEIIEEIAKIFKLPRTLTSGYKGRYVGMYEIPKVYTYESTDPNLSFRKGEYERGALFDRFLSSIPQVPNYGKPSEEVALGIEYIKLHGILRDSNGRLLGWADKKHPKVSLYNLKARNIFNTYYSPLFNQESPNSINLKVFGIESSLKRIGFEPFKNSAKLTLADLQLFLKEIQQVEKHDEALKHIYLFLRRCGILAQNDEQALKIFKSIKENVTPVNYKDIATLLFASLTGAIPAVSALKSSKDNVMNANKKLVKRTK